VATAFVRVYLFSFRA